MAPSTQATASSPSTSSSSSSDSAKKLFWFNISGLIGTALHYLTYNAMLMAMPEEWDSRTTLAWVTSYLLSIVWQHSLHRHLVFGAGGPYWSSLLATYVSYAASIVLSSGLTYGLEMMGAGEQVAYFLATAGTGVINFFTLQSAFEEKKETKTA